MKPEKKPKFWTKMQRRRLHEVVEHLVDLVHIIPSLPQLAECQFVPSAHVLVYWLKSLVESGLVLTTQTKVRQTLST
jgi:hypothetical protein